MVIEIFVFLFGIIFGSFFNVVAFRSLNEESIVSPPSRCNQCHYQLKWYDNIPVLSYIVLKGRCRACQATISWKYPFFELITGFVFIASYMVFGFTLHALFIVLLLSLLHIVSLTDIESRIIPNKVLLWFSVPLFVLSLFAPYADIQSKLLGFAGLFAMFFLILFITKGKGIGGGDVKLFLLLSVLFGVFNIFIIFYLSACIGLVYGLYFLLRKKRQIPFAPAIFLSVIIFVFCEAQVFEILVWLQELLH